MSLSKGIGGAASGMGAGAAIGGPVGAIVGGIGGLISGLFSDDNSEEITRLRKEAVDLYNKFGPVDLSDPVLVRQLVQAGELSPNFEQYVETEKSKKIEENPEMRREQRAALDAIKQLSRTGLGVEDRVAMNQLRNQAAQDAQARQQQIIQQMAQRGQAGDGAELAMQIAGTQSGAQQLSEGADRMAAQASAARRNAIGQLFQGAGQMRGTDLDLARSNTDIENKDIDFRNVNSLQRQNRNVDRSNRAQEFNVNRQQNVSDTNIGMSNRELYRQRQAKRDYFNDQLNYSNAKAKALQGQADALAGEDSANNQSFSDMWSGIGGIAQAGKDSGLWNDVGSGISGIFKDKSEPTYGKKNDGPQHMLAGFAHGGKVEGPELVKGDHSVNDVIPSLLSAGEIVVPKSHATPNKAAEFVEKVNNENQKPRKNGKKKVLTSLADLLKSLDEMDN